TADRAAFHHGKALLLPQEEVRAVDGHPPVGLLVHYSASSSGATASSREKGDIVMEMVSSPACSITLIESSFWLATTDRSVPVECSGITTPGTRCWMEITAPGFSV